MKRYSAAEIALLAIFAAGLLLSHILVTVRNRIVLGEPVRLAVDDLAAALPTGEPWQTAGGWQYESDNSFVLLGVMRSRGQAVMTVRWRYALCDAAMDVESLLRLRAETADGRLQPLGEAAGDVAMQFGRILTPTQSGEEFMFGAAELAFGRRLELQINYRGDPLYAENAFRTLVGGLVYEPSGRVAAGADEVERFLRAADQTISRTGAPSETGLLLKDAAEQPRGFSVRRVFSHTNDEDGHVRITTRQLDEPNRFYAESDMWLTVGETTFSWTTQTWPLQSQRSRVIELRADQAGQLIVRTNGQRTRTLRRTPMMLPESMLTEFAAARLSDEGDGMLIDVLTGGGFVVPTRFSRIDPADSVIAADRPVRIVRAEYLHQPGAYDDFIFDADGASLGYYEQQPRRPGRLWNTATEAQLRRIFGDRFAPRDRDAVRRLTDEQTITAKH